VEKISEEWSSRLRMSQADIQSYLLNNVLYSFDAQQLAGLNLFYTMARDIPGMGDFRSLNFIPSAVLLAAKDGRTA
jgi:hypothetical protein